MLILFKACQSLFNVHACKGTCLHVHKKVKCFSGPASPFLCMPAIYKKKERIKTIPLHCFCLQKVPEKRFLAQYRLYGTLYHGVYGTYI